MSLWYIPVFAGGLAIGLFGSTAYLIVVMSRDYKDGR